MDTTVKQAAVRVSVEFIASDDVIDIAVLECVREAKRERKPDSSVGIRAVRAAVAYIYEMHGYAADIGGADDVGVDEPDDDEWDRIAKVRQRLGI